MDRPPTLAGVYRVVSDLLRFLGDQDVLAVADRQELLAAKVHQNVAHLTGLLRLVQLGRDLGTGEPRLGHRADHLANALASSARVSQPRIRGPLGLAELAGLATLGALDRLGCGRHSGYPRCSHVV